MKKTAPRERSFFVVSEETMMYHDFEHRIMDRERRAVMESMAGRSSEERALYRRILNAIGTLLVQAGTRLQDRPAV